MAHWIKRIKITVRRDRLTNAFDRFKAALTARYCNYRKTTIYAGSNEIQRNIIAKRVLEL